MLLETVTSSIKNSNDQTIRYAKLSLKKIIDNKRELFFEEKFAENKSSLKKELRMKLKIINQFSKVIEN